MQGSLWEVWESTARAAPGKLAAIDAASAKAHTRMELSAAAAEIAKGAPAEVKAGDAVAFAASNSIGWLALFLALQKLDACAMPLDAGLPGEQKASVARTLGAAWLVERGQWRRLNASLTEGAGCVVKTTSGTTGQAKPIHCTAENMLADGKQIMETMEISGDDINLAAVPFGHSYGLGNLVMPLIMEGAAVVCSTEMLPAPLADQIERHCVTVFPSAPAIFRALAESSVPRDKLRTLRRAISAGAPLSPAAASAFRDRFGLPIQNFYGSSETGGICFDAMASGRGVGLPLKGVEVEIAEDGRVRVRSSAVVGEGVHLLPDTGRWNAHGELILTGRLSSLANVGGKKVAPQEIENALRALEGVTDAWVGVGTRNAIGGSDYLAAAVETSRLESEIKRDLAARLSEWQIPRRLLVCATLPRTSRGKLDRAELERRLFAHAPAPGGDAI